MPRSQGGQICGPDRARTGDMMKHRGMWIGVLSGITLLSSCSVEQQRQVLGTVGMVIPGSSTSIIRSSSSETSAETSAESPPESPAPPVPQVNPARTDAQWVLQTIQRAMADNPSPFQECLGNDPCKLALTAHLIRLQAQAGETLALPPVYDRYDLKRGQE